jgi:3-phosphoshikimate 1-carboxyvinyltransferase
MWWSAPTSEAVNAVVELPGSKSLTNRALVLAAIADGPSTVRRPLRSRDTELMAAALQSLGASIDTSGTDWLVAPIGAPPAEVTIDCGLAGTVMRFVPAVAAAVSTLSHFDGDEHARSRPMGSMITALRGVGTLIDDEGRGSLPFTVHGDVALAGGTVQIDASASSQFVSALLLAAPRYARGIEVEHVGSPIPSQPHLDMTVACLRDHGVTVDDSKPNRWRVEPGVVRALDVAIEPDLSNAAPFLMLAMTTGGQVTIPHWPASTTQPGDALRDLLTRMGAAISLSEDGLTIKGTGRIHGIEVDLHDLGELTPALAALCALADSPSHLYGIAHIRGHETDRLAALATELARLGSKVEETPDGLRIEPATLHGSQFRTYADHRMAHAAVIIGSVVPDVEVENIETTAKTFPGFADAWSKSLGL